MKLIYVAGRFSGANHWEVAENVRAAERVALEVAKIGGFPITPHANSAHFFGTLPESFWLAGYIELLHRCDAVMMVPGWEKSKGACAERDEAFRYMRPVFTHLPYLAEWLVLPENRR